MNAKISLLFVFAVMFAVHGAHAARSDWYETDGGRLRLVTAGGINPSGIITGVLEIELKEGWKTYWMDPGDAGIPPQIDISQSEDISEARILFPVPQRFDDGYAVWAGYKGDVHLVIEFHVGKKPLIDATVFLGICETICIPVQTRFLLDPMSGDSEEDYIVVETARAQLPAQPKSDFKVTELKQTGENALTGEFIVPFSPEKPELFLASAHGWSFRSPKLMEQGDRRYFTIEIIRKPDGGSGPVEIPYTLVTGAISVSGRVELQTEASQ